MIYGTVWYFDISYIIYLTHGYDYTVIWYTVVHSVQYTVYIIQYTAYNTVYSIQYTAYSTVYQSVYQISPYRYVQVCAACQSVVACCLDAQMSLQLLRKTNRSGGGGWRCRQGYLGKSFDPHGMSTLAIAAPVVGDVQCWGSGYVGGLPWWAGSIRITVWPYGLWYKITSHMP